MRPVIQGFGSFLFKAKDIHTLADPEAQLNDIYMNGFTALLYSELIEHEILHIAVFSTHAPPKLGIKHQTRICGTITRRQNFGRNLYGSSQFTDIHYRATGVLCTIHFNS